MDLRTGYLSATRGDGGQNLIGAEIREGLGIIRTQELLAARGVDGGEQFFSRANDFGYSKHPDETFQKWNKRQVLADFVYVIRKFRPDVIITRFSQQPGITHGHHTASAMLAMEAFEMSGDPKAFPEQLGVVDAWSPSQIFYNVSLWYYSRSGETFEPDGHIQVDVGAYDPVLGVSYTEMSAKSRSMHKSQGFGVLTARGSEMEYLKQWGGKPVTKLFEGIDTSWGRVEGADQVSYFLAEAKRNFDPSEPAGIVPQLLGARKELLKLPDQYWKKVKMKELDELLLLVTGVYIGAYSTDQTLAVGDTARINVEVVNRSRVSMKVGSVHFNVSDERFLYGLALGDNQPTQLSFDLPIPSEASPTDPYWLAEPSTNDAMYQVSDPQMIGKAEGGAAIVATVALNLDGHYIDYEVPVKHRERDPVRGEVINPIAITPAVMINIPNGALIFGSSEPKEYQVTVLAGQDDVGGEVKLNLPEGWISAPVSLPFSVGKKGQEVQLTFKITPPTGASEGEVSAYALMDGSRYGRQQVKIAYDHIPTQYWFPEATSKLVKLDLKTAGKKIGYIMGAGDEISSGLRNIGYQVDHLEKDDINAYDLKQYDAVILGVRAFNTLEWLSYKNQELFKYVYQGGNLIVQYNTSHRLVTQEVGPYPITLSRDRVTVESAQVHMLESKSDVLKYPNKIKQIDFDGWVQERGLYFPQKWSEEYHPILSMADPGEEPLTGSLLVAKHGQGYYFYTGLSFFRELPAGVTGAYKLLVNMISQGHKPNP